MRAWRAQQRSFLVKGLLAYAGKAHLLAPSVPWLKRLLDALQVAEETRQQAAEAYRLESLLKATQKALDSAEERLTALEREKRNREARQRRQRERREEGIVLPSDPPAIRDHYQQADRPSAFAPTSPTFGPRIGPDLDRVGTEPSQFVPAVGTPFGHETPKPAPEDGQDWHRYISIPVARPGSLTPAAAGTPASAQSKDAALLARIKANGYRVNEAGQVLFDSRWVSVEEWMRRNGSVLD